MSHSIIEYALPVKISLSKLHKDMKSQFPCHSESLIHLERIYQDSFDCRLYKNNYEYYIEEYHGRINLFLHSVNSVNNAHILSVNEIPKFAHDFKSVVFNRIMNSALDVRALMPLVVLNIKRRIMVLVSSENKIYAYLHLDEINIKKPQCQQKLLGKCLRILPVKGYENATHQLMTYCEDDLKLSRADETLLKQALKITKSSYCPLMVFPHHDLKPDMRTDEAVKAILLSELEIIELNEDGLINDIDTEFLHDYRVAVRRTRSVLKQIKGVFHKRIVDRHNTIFSWLGKMTGPLRDMHVYLLKLDHYQQQLPDELKPHLESLRAFLLNHERIEHDKLIRELAKKRYLNIKLNWRNFLGQPVPEKVNLPNAEKNVKQVADAMIWDAYAKVIAYGSKIKDSSPDERFHRMRIKCKKLRYLLEFFCDLYSQKNMSSILKSLKNLQNMLGNFQDISVQTNSLRTYESQMKEEGMLTEQTLNAMEFLVEYLNEAKKSIRHQYIENFVLLSGKKTESRFTKLFNTGS